MTSCGHIASALPTQDRLRTELPTTSFGTGHLLRSPYMQSGVQVVAMHHLIGRINRGLLVAWLLCATKLHSIADWCWQPHPCGGVLYDGDVC